MNANSSLTINDWLIAARKQLKDAGIPSYQLDALLLLEFALKTDRVHLLAHTDKPLTIAQHTALNELLTQRKSRKPIAYITNRIEFYGRDFFVDKNVLIPRPESEAFITLAKKYNFTHESIVDVGSGSGVLGITLKLELPKNHVTLLDIDPLALKVAKKNMNNLNADCSLVQADLLPATNHFSIIVANLPYVPKDMYLEPELDYEPSLALFADNGGLALYEALWQKISGLASCKYVMTESLRKQHQTQKAYAKAAGYSLLETEGLVQIFQAN